MKKKQKKLYKSIHGRNYDRVVTLSINRVKRMIKRLIFNKIMLAIVAGLLVGSLFGLTSLRFLTDNSDAHVFQEQSFMKEQQSQASTSDTFTKVNVDVPSVYVIQVGLFHERENAELRKRQLERGKVATFIWQRNGEFFLLHSSHSSESKAKQMNEQLHDGSLEAFVKQWDIPTMNKRITADELQFIEQFVHIWEQSLHQVEASSSIPIAEWQSLQEIENKHESPLISDIQLNLVDIVPMLRDEHLADSALLQLLFLLEESVVE